MEKIKIEDGNCIINEKDNQKLYELIGLTAPISCNKCSIAVTRLGANGHIIKHLHMEAEEIYIFTAGSAIMKVNDLELRVGAGDTVFINKKDVHEMHTSEKENVEFYAITIPPFIEKDFIVI